MPRTVHGSSLAILRRPDSYQLSEHPFSAVSGNVCLSSHGTSGIRVVLASECDPLAIQSIGRFYRATVGHGGP
jgi:hypothetical protein